MCKKNYLSDLFVVFNNLQNYSCIIIIIIKVAGNDQSFPAGLFNIYFEFFK